MSIDDPAFVRALAERHAAAPVRVRFLGEGSNNTVFLAEGSRARTVVKLAKPHREAGALGEFEKEAWCVAQARARGIATPQVLKTGVRDGRPFAVLEFVDGRAPDASEADRIYHELGGIARQVHAVAVEGWGFAMAGGVFTQNWPEHLAYNIASLTPDDPLLALGVVDAASSARLRVELERLQKTAFNFGLCHGDLALQNTLIDNAGKTWLLDWGCAGAHVVPHYEINEIARKGQPLDAFLVGYGLTPADFAVLQPDLVALAALREIDTLRWALEKQPGAVAELTDRARQAVARLTSVKNR